MSRTLPWTLCSAVLLATPACALVNPTPKLANSQRLIARPDFQQATRAAPEWVREALKTVNRLEEQIEAGRK